MRVSQQQIFQRYLAEYAATHAMGVQQQRAARCIAGCGTRAMGAHVLTCPSGACEQLQFHACRHRSCPRCAQAARDDWIDAQMQRLLPCAHFHVIFTLPHELIGLWAYNRAEFAALLLRCVRETLLQVMANPRFVGVVPGVLLSLHTWGRTLSYHPHVHCLVSAGGLDSGGGWKACRSDWLLPVKALQGLFRGKLLHHVLRGLQSGSWRVPPSANLAAWRQDVRRLYRKHWNVEIRPPYAHGRGVVLYLARYARGGPLSSDRNLDLDGHTVRLRYLDHRDQQTKTLALHVHEFISRVLWHVPPNGVHTLRHAGLYSTALRGQHRLALQHLLQAPPAFERPWPRTFAVPVAAVPAVPTCPHCGLPMLRLRSLPPQHALPMHQPGETSPPSRHQGAPPALPPPGRGPTLRSSRHRMAEPGPATRPSHRGASRGQPHPCNAA